LVTTNPVTGFDGNTGIGGGVVTIGSPTLARCVFTDTETR